MFAPHEFVRNAIRGMQSCNVDDLIGVGWRGAWKRRENPAAFVLFGGISRDFAGWVNPISGRAAAAAREAAVASRSGMSSESPTALMSEMSWGVSRASPWGMSRAAGPREPWPRVVCRAAAAAAGIGPAVAGIAADIGPAAAGIAAGIGPAAAGIADIAPAAAVGDSAAEEGLWSSRPRRARPRTRRLSR